MKKHNRTFIICALASAVLLSLPWLIPGTGFLALFGFVPLLVAEKTASASGARHFWRWHYLAFVLWNAATTFWVCNATVGGGIFAVLANAAQMSLVFGLFRWSKRHLRGCLPYIFLAATWIAWERFYFSAEISWPWLTLGNAFARTTQLAQWYSITGVLGGSLWIWLVSLGTFGLLVLLSGEGPQTSRARTAAICGLAAAIILPAAASFAIYFSFEERSEGKVSVLAGQPDFDPYQKFQSMTQAQQTAVLLDLYADKPVHQLYLAPETFTSDVILNSIGSGRTWNSFKQFLSDKEGSNLLFGASTYELFNRRSAPSVLARKNGDGWYENHNSAIMMDGNGKTEVYHKSKLVVGTEKTPFPKLFTKVDDLLGGVMGRCIPQEEPSVLHLGDGTPVGCAVCYESVYGEHCSEYVRRGAKFLTVITNDAWWGDTPGYKQHLSYSALRAIELRRDIARSANTGISAFINQRGDIVSRTQWWTPDALSGEVNLNSEITAFAKYGDVTGKACTLTFLLLLLLLLSSLFRKE